MSKIVGKAKTISLIATLTGLSTAVCIGAVTLYDSFFKRQEKKELYAYYGEFDYSRVKDKINRQLFTFKSGKNTLQGYFYEALNSKGIVVVSHGMHAGADDYLPFIIYLVEHQYSVFTYDSTGTYLSEGKSTIGMCTPLVDLDYALRFLNERTEFKEKPIFLFGHSWGGYAATSVLSIHKNIKACAAIAPFNSGYTLIMEKGEQYAGKFAGGLPKVFLEVYQAYLFKDYIKYSGVKGINDTNIPVLIAHGIDDKIIDIDYQSIISHKDEIRKENVYYYIGEGLQSGHNTILHSENAIKYQEYINKKYKQIKKELDRELTKEEKIDFCNLVDHRLYSEVNFELMDQIISLYDKTLIK